MPMVKRSPRFLWTISALAVALAWGPLGFAAEPSITEKGQASFYGPGLEGHETASGEPFDPSAMTAAHRTLPFGSEVRVTNTENDQSVVVTINDRGPKAKDNIIDLSQGAAQKLGISAEEGVAEVTLEVVSQPDP